MKCARIMLVGAFGSEEGQGGASVSVEGVQMRGQIRGPGEDGQNEGREGMRPRGRSDKGSDEVLFALLGSRHSPL